MYKAIKNLFLSLMLVMSVISSAIPVDKSTALRVAVNFWKSNSHTSRIECDLQLSPLSYNQGYSTFFIFENALGGGFVIVAADDCVTPILAYSATAPVGDDVIPANTKTILSWYDKQINYCVSKDVTPTREISAMWQRYMSDKIIVDKSANSVNPMLTTKWNQSPIYNNLCPTDGISRDHVVTGCVAVAMAQAIKYWNHPITGIGRNSYNHDKYGTLTAEFNNTTYDWANMPNELNRNTSYVQNTAVATLMFHCGVSCNMNYSTEGSSASVNGNRYGTSEYAFKNFFGYKKSLHSISRDDYTDSAWTEVLRDDLDHGRPIVYTGYDYTDTNDVVGHAFVCDGYDTNDCFHFNWGWGGQCDGYFKLSNLNPSHVFNETQRAIIGMEPDSNLLQVTPTSITMQGAGGSGTVTVMSAPNDSNDWSASTQQNWITLSRTTGPGLGANTSLRITAAENTTGYSRNGFVDIVQDSQLVQVYVFQPDASHSNAGWYGNDIADAAEEVAQSSNMIIIRPESYGSFAPGDKVTHIKFKTRKQAPLYTNSNFTIMIFRNTNYSSTLDSGQCDANSVFGRQVYSENYSITNSNIEQIVPLSEPYIITESPFWIALRSSGNTLYKAHSNCISNIPDGDAPIIDSIKGHYLRSMVPGQVCAAFETSNYGGSWTQCEIEYCFQFLVELGRDGIESQPQREEVLNVSVYPNPTTGIVNFSEVVKHVEVYDNMGRRVAKADNTFTLDISDKSKGLYTLRVTTQQGTVIRKVVKQR